MSLDELDRGRTVFSVVADELYENPMGTMHGGIVATLVDTAMGCAVSSTLPADASFTTLELSTKFVRAITAATGRVHAEGKVVHSGGRVATTDARVYDDAGVLYAHATSTCMITRRTAMSDARPAHSASTALHSRFGRSRSRDVERLVAVVHAPVARRRCTSGSSRRSREPPRSALLRLADVDHVRRDALVALDGDEIVAVARYDAVRPSPTGPAARPRSRSRSRTPGSTVASGSA